MTKRLSKNQWIEDGVDALNSLDPKMADDIVNLIVGLNCPECGCKIKNQKNLERHLRKVHKIYNIKTTKQSQQETLNRTITYNYHYSDNRNKDKFDYFNDYSAVKD